MSETHTTPADEAKQSPRWRRPAVLIPLGIVAAVVAVVVLYLFQPWKLFVDDVVNEEFPVATAPASEPAATPDPGDTAAPEPTPAPAEPVVLASGEFISHEHTTTGSARIVELPDGSRVLRIENLDTSNGPDLKVWLTDAPVIEGRDGWGVFDDGRWLDLGPLKGNQGSQNYEIPADADLTGLTSVSIWCDRFNVSFGAAELA